MKLDPVVKKENLYMLIGSVICTAVVQLVFLIAGKYDYTVALGGLWGLFITVLNFFIMTVAIQRAVELSDEQTAKMKIQASYTKRMLLMVALMVVGVVVPQINWIPVLISVFYPRIVITVRGGIASLKNKNTEAVTTTADSSEAEDGSDFDEDEEEDELEKFVGFFGKKAASKITDSTAASAAGNENEAVIKDKAEAENAENLEDNSGESCDSDDRLKK